MSGSRVAPRRALLSVSDKTGLEAFARQLADAGVELISTGGTARILNKAGLDVISVSDITGFPEIMDGRVKTLHPKVHGGILARRGSDDQLMQEHDIQGIDLVCVNLYPFAKTVAEPDCGFEKAIENIDIGGPAMVRAAAKNHQHVAIVTDPADYQRVADAVSKDGVDDKLRRELALKAFSHTASYDAEIAAWLSGQTEAARPQTLLRMQSMGGLRYGENPHQSADLLAEPDGKPGETLARANIIQGKALSYNNLADADAALDAVRCLPERAACVIVKHANPCGIALADSPLDAYRRAFAGDPTSAFGGILAFNRRLDGEAVGAILEQQFLEVLIAPEISADAREKLASKPNVRALEVSMTINPAPRLRSIDGGLLQQQPDVALGKPEYKVVSRAAPSNGQWADLEFAWRIVRFIKSNAIVLVRDGQTLGIGAGQMSRVDSVELAIRKARQAGFGTEGAVLASDAFFPFADGVEKAIEAGVASIVQPGGSIRDKDVIETIDEAGISMVLTGVRHFRH